MNHDREKVRLTDTKVPGKKMVVRKAIIFIAELSRLLAVANSLESRAIPRFNWLSCWAIRLNNYDESISFSIFPSSRAGT